MEYKIVTRDVIKLVGTLYHTSMQTAGGIPGMWDTEFLPRMKEIKHVIHSNCYGLEIYPDNFVKTDQFTYMAACEVSKIENVPFNMYGVTLPISTYAVFTIKGKLDPDKIMKTFQAIYYEWLPKSEFVMPFPYDFEFYDGENNRFKPDQDDCELDIYLPVERK